MGHDGANPGGGRVTPTLSLEHVARPPSVGVDGPPPMLVLLHGVGSNERSMARLAPAFDSRLLVISARSPIVLGPDSFAWFHVTFTEQGPAINADEAAAGWARVAQFVDEAVAAYGADAERVFVGGFSQGAIISLATMLTAPEKIAGAIAMSGRLLPEVLPHAAAPERLHGKPVLIVHGTDDEKLGIHYARSARDKLSQFPIALDYHELPMGHAVTAETLAVVTRWVSERLDAPVKV
jgi:phospholipase/carboxylesterase